MYDLEQDNQPEDPLLQLLIDNNIPVTRENYLILMFMGNPPPWSAEHEDQIPAELQDWHSKTFEQVKKEPSNQSNSSRHGFFSLSVEELEELGRET